MKILANIGVIAAAVLAIAAVLWESLLLTIFSATREFAYAGDALASAILMLALGVVLRTRVRRWITIGSSLVFSVISAVVLFFDVGLQEGYVPRMEISLPNWHFTIFTWIGMGFGIIPLLLLITKRAKTPEPTPGSVTPRAGARVAPDPGVAHLERVSAKLRYPTSLWIPKSFLRLRARL